MSPLAQGIAAAISGLLQVFVRSGDTSSSVGKIVQEALDDLQRTMDREKAAKAAEDAALRGR